MEHTVIKLNIELHEFMDRYNDYDSCFCYYFDVLYNEKVLFKIELNDKYKEKNNLSIGFFIKNQYIHHNKTIDFRNTDDFFKEFLLLMKNSIELNKYKFDKEELLYMNKALKDLYASENITKMNNEKSYVISDVINKYIKEQPHFSIDFMIASDDNQFYLQSFYQNSEEFNYNNEISHLNHLIVEEKGERLFFNNEKLSSLNFIELQTILKNYNEQVPFKNHLLSFLDENKDKVLYKEILLNL